MMMVTPVRQFMLPAADAPPKDSSMQVQWHCFMPRSLSLPSQLPLGQSLTPAMPPVQVAAPAVSQMHDRPLREPPWQKPSHPEPYTVLPIPPQ
jgi:hypothetical protein